MARASMMVREALLGVIVAALATGCAATSTRRAAPDADRSGRISSDVITTSELNRLPQGLTVMAAIEQARPWFLHSRGSVPAVSVDGSPPRELSVLLLIPAADVTEVRLTRGAGSSAAIRADGAVVVGDVILVSTRRGP
jgi:hypothetical protein